MYKNLRGYVIAIVGALNNANNFPKQQKVTKLLYLSTAHQVYHNGAKATLPHNTYTLYHSGPTSERVTQTIDKEIKRESSPLESLPKWTCNGNQRLYIDVESQSDVESITPKSVDQTLVNAIVFNYGEMSCNTLREVIAERTECKTASKYEPVFVERQHANIQPVFETWRHPFTHCQD